MADSGQYTSDTLTRRAMLAQSLLQSGMETTPLRSPWQGAARVAQALVGGMALRKDTDQQREATSQLGRILSGQPASAPMGQAAAIGATAAGGDVNDKSIPAAIRYNNPGAQWDGPSATKYGSTGYGVIGGGNHIAQFPDPVAGAAAQFDLLGRKYAGKPLSAAIQQWSGGNSSPEYTARVAQAIGVDPNAPLTPDMLRNPQIAIPMAKAMAQQEAGRPYPMSDQDWQKAHAMAYGGQQPTQVASLDPSAGVNPQQAQQPQAQPQMAQGQQLAQAQPMQAAGGQPDMRAAIQQMLQSSNPYVQRQGAALAQTLIGQQMAPPELKMVKDAMGQDHPVAWNAHNQSLTPLNVPGGFGGVQAGASNDDLMKSAEAQYPGVTNRVEQLYRGEGGMPNGRMNKIDGPAMQLIQQVHPDWNMTMWTAKNKMQTQLSSGQPSSLGGRLSALRNAFDHLGNTSDTAIAKGNMDLGLSPLSYIGNKLQGLSTAQSDLSKQLEREATTYGGERTKFLTGAEGSESERRAFLDALGPNTAAPAQMAGTIEGEYTQLKSALLNQEQQIREQLGDDYLKKKPIITPEVKASMDKIEKNIERLRGHGRQQATPQKSAPSGNDGWGDLRTH